MYLHELHLDAVLRILSCLDAATLLTVARVNKFFHVAVSTKQLWINLVDSLAAREIMDAPPREVLKKLSTNALIEEVRRAVVGPHTWNQASVDPPTVWRQNRVAPTAMWDSVEILPGGRYIAFYISVPGLSLGGGECRRIECWEIHSGLQVWSWARVGSSVSEARFHFRGGSLVVVVLMFMNEILVLEVDFTTRTSKQLLQIKRRIVTASLTIEGDFFVCESVTEPRRSFVLLADWRNGRYITFDGIDSQPVAFTLCTGHLILAYHVSTTRPGVYSGVYSADKIYVHNLESFAHLWQPICDFNPSNRTDITDVPAVILPFTATSQGGVSFRVLGSPLHDDVLEFIVTTHLDGLSVKSRYHLALTYDTASSPSLSGTLKFVSSRTYNGWSSRVGYGVSRVSGTLGSSNRTVVLTSHEGSIPPALPIRDSQNVQSVTLTSSGAVVTHYFAYVDVLYYL
ncbi:hypothetical protein C8R43DRAFT_1240988 [Mycena crocata]|nr:hypothetical protein C8R43DRAFT_1240988 [Mycena crocata]